MALWDKISSRGSVEDRRGSSLALRGGGLSIGGLAIILLLNYFSGGTPSDVLNELQNVAVQNQSLDRRAFEGADNYEVFASTVLGSTNDMWSKIFAESNLNYNLPKLVLFREATEGSCGLSTSEVGPHYCSIDQTIYLDETFFDEIQKKLKANGGDVAQAYVIAHEVGHHVQNQLGTIAEDQTNEGSVKQELQADCFAGLWANSIKDTGVFEPGEIQEALDTAAAIGDDRIQQTVQGRIAPESWTHGSSEQRVEWFSRGFNSGLVEQCAISSN